MNVPMMLTEEQLKDLTRTAMVRHYLKLKTTLINLIDVSNELYGFVETNYEPDHELESRLEKFDKIVDNL